MNEKDLAIFLQNNHFLYSADYSIKESGMSSKIDAFKANDLLIRIVHDRGQKFIDLSRLGSNYWEDIFTIAYKVDSNFNVKTGSFSEAIVTLISYWAKIYQLLNKTR